MPQLDTVTYLTQYIWTLIILFFLFSLLVNTILPRLQQQLAIRAKLSTIRNKISSEELEKVRNHWSSKLEILKTLFQLK